MFNKNRPCSVIKLEGPSRSYILAQNYISMSEINSSYRRVGESRRLHRSAWLRKWKNYAPSIDYFISFLTG